MIAGLRLQGRVFCGIALVLVAASLTGARLEPPHELLLAGTLLLLLGMPHGAFDVVFARRLLGVSGLMGWAMFSLCYAGLSAVVVGLWWVAPALFLCVFLAASAQHFGDDAATGAPRLVRLLYGGSIIVLPALWHSAELQRLLGLVAGPSSAALVTPALSLLAVPWLCATVFAAGMRARRAPWDTAEWFSLAALSLVAPPLLAFTTYFCVMHSPRHILVTLAGLPGAQVRRALSMALWPTLAVLAAAVGVTRLASGISLEMRVMQIVFVGLAALTLPHMILLALARRAGLATERKQQGVQQPQT